MSEYTQLALEVGVEPAGKTVVQGLRAFQLCLRPRAARRMSVREAGLRFRHAESLLLEVTRRPHLLPEPY